MSDTRRPRPLRRQRDQGMTLPELMIAVTVSALIATMLVGAITVTLRQARGTEGRLNVANAEQMIGMWLPGDLASASAVTTDPAATLCYGEACPANPTGGSNALLVTWEIDRRDEADQRVTVRTSVMYYFRPADEGGYELVRYACDDSAGAWACSDLVVLRDLDPPPAGLEFTPGVTRPDWVIQVSEPLAPDEVDDGQPDKTTENIKNARRVVVTVNGGGTSAGAGGGTNQISITAGGTARSIIDGTSLQGAPTFTEALSKCGGPMVLVVDESNSIGNAIGTVKQAVKDFVLALAGTPVKLQIVGFHTTSHVLGTTEWHKYYDMTDEAQVTELYNAVDSLKGSWSQNPYGGTNWEEALFRTFYTPEATTAAIMPETVVFFTDGVPTFDRLVHRTSPGILPSEPPDPGEPWPDSTGSSYSQVAFNRANYIATWARASVNLIGVGVGADITKSSTWISNPGAGYHWEWQRGSYSYVRESTQYQLRYQKRNSSSGSWYWVSKSVYDSSPTYDNRDRLLKRDQGWTAVDQSTYLTVENPPNSNNNSDWNNDGARTVLVQTPVSTAEYLANTSNPAYKPVAKTWSNGPDWEPWTGSRSGIPEAQLKQVKVYAQPYTDYDAATTQSVSNDKILGRLVAGGDNYVSAIWNGSRYTNVATANLYTSTNWAQLPVALKAIALGECGGTLTLQTRIGGNPAADPFTYQNSQQYGPDGSPLVIEPRVVRTNRQFTTGTFEFDIADGLYRDVVVLPENLSDLGAYHHVNWACRAGNQPREFSVVDIPGGEASGWKGIRVRVGANEAVSCIQTVAR